MTTTLSKTITNAASNPWAVTGATTVNFEAVGTECKVEDTIFKELRMRSQGIGQAVRQQTLASKNIINDFKLIIRGFVLSGWIKDIPSGDSALTIKNKVQAMAESGVKSGGMTVFTYGGESINVEFKQVKFIEYPGQPAQYQYVIELVRGDVRVSS